MSLIIGMMSGTSVDSIDALLCDVTGDASRIQARVLHFIEQPMSPALRERIFRLFQNGPGSLALACSLNFEIGEAFADTALKLLEQARTSASSIAAIASHGQTAWHIPPHSADAVTEFPSTLQIGEGSVIAERTGIRVICDFRVADMAAGGNGAPLVPFADFHLFGAPDGAIVHNIGGISNCTLVPASGRIEDVVAFDTGPGNMIIDALVSHFYPGESFDRDGAHAAAGTVDCELLERWMTIPYITAPPPKTTGRELFGVQFASQILREHPDMAPDDLIATATAFTARSIVVNVRDFLLPRSPRARMFVGGGGAANTTIMNILRHELQPDGVRVDQLDAAGVNYKQRECLAFAILGYARLQGIPANVPSATGAHHPALLGKIVDFQSNR